MNADIVAIQEVEVNTETQKTRIWSVEHADDQPALLGATTGLFHTAFAPAVTSISLGTMKEEHDTPLSSSGIFGIGILSRFPILEQKVIKFQKYKGKTQRNALAVKVQPSASSDPIWFVCTHLGCHTGAEQLQQARELSTWMCALDGSVLCCGDTNSPQWFAAIKALTQGGFVDVGGCRTFPAIGKGVLAISK